MQMKMRRIVSIIQQALTKLVALTQAGLDMITTDIMT